MRFRVGDRVRPAWLGDASDHVVGTVTAIDPGHTFPVCVDWAGDWPTQWERRRDLVLDECDAPL
jgi:hypothetical protein